MLASVQIKLGDKRFKKVAAEPFVIKEQEL